MGDNYLRQQAGNFRKRRDLAIAEAAEAPLFHRPEVIETLYAVMPDPGERLEEGEVLYVMLGDSEGEVQLVRRNRKLGRLEGQSVRALMNALAEPSGAGVARVRVVEVASLSGVARVRLLRDGEYDD